MALWSSFVKQSRSGKKPGPPVPDDLLRRDVSASAVKELWFTDVAEHTTSEEELYLCSLEGAYSGRIVGSIGERMTSELCVSALRNAISLRQPVGATVHADGGSQGEFKRSSQHLEYGGVNGKTGRMDERTNWASTDEVARIPGTS